MNKDITEEVRNVVKIELKDKIAQRVIELLEEEEYEDSSPSEEESEESESEESGSETSDLSERLDELEMEMREISVKNNESIIRCNKALALLKLTAQLLVIFGVSLL